MDVWKKLRKKKKKKYLEMFKWIIKNKEFFKEKMDLKFKFFFKLLEFEYLKE